MADDVTKTVNTVKDIDHKAGNDGGAVNAYHELKKEYDDYAKTHSAEDTKKYWDGVTAQLKDKNVLPDMAVAWGKENGADGKTANDITRDFNFADKYNLTSNSPQFQFDKAFAQQLGSQVGDLTKLQDGWHPLGLGSDGDHIHTQELDKYLENQASTNTDNAKKQGIRDEQSPLFKGNPPLIQVLDGANDNDKLDGHVSRDDMNRYMEDYKRFTNDGKNPAPDGSPYSKANAQYVQDILDGKHNDLGKHDTAWYQDGIGDAKDGFSVGDLAQAGGYKAGDIHNAGDYKAVTDSFTALQPSTDTPATTATPGVKTDGDNTTVTYADGRQRSFHFNGDNLDKVTDFNGTFHKDGSNKWVDDSGKAAPFKDVSVDRTTGTVTYDNGDQGKLVITKDDGLSGVTTDSSGNTITSNGDTYTVHEKGANKDLTVKVKSMGGGPDGSPDAYDVTLPDGKHYTRDDSGKWTGPDGKKDFHFDSKTGNLSYTGEDNKPHQMDASGKITDGTASSTITTDSNGAQLTANDSGQVTDITYKDGSKRHFDYTNGKLSSFTNPDGHTFTSTDNGKTFTSPGFEPLHNVVLDKDGTLHVTNAENQSAKIGTDGKQVTDDHPPTSTDTPDQAALDKAKAKLFDEATQQVGEGPYQSAARILGDKASQQDIMALTMALKHAWQDANGDPNHQNDKMTGLQVGTKFLTPENIDKILQQCPALKAKLDELAKADTGTAT